MFVSFFLIPHRQIYVTVTRYKYSSPEKPLLSFCAKPKGEVAESNIKEDTNLPEGEGGGRHRRWVRV